MQNMDPFFDRMHRILVWSKHDIQLHFSSVGIKLQNIEKKFKRRQSKNKRQKKRQLNMLCNYKIL